MIFLDALDKRKGHTYRDYQPHPQDRSELNLSLTKFYQNLVFL